MEKVAIHYDKSIQEHLFWLLSQLPKDLVKFEKIDTKKNDLDKALQKTKGILNGFQIDPIAYQNSLRDDR